ncbi:diguanylate cyclase [Novosphingobium bradum]|uniref:diguanylate cyclase n=1 Tax=Novosphingobium bradum TaxID=1737444 RepID=A0ABV7IQH0_9SPHN
MFKFLSRSAEASAASPSSGPSQADGGAGPLRGARRDLLERIADFLVRHDLEVTARNLAIAQAAFSGADLGLAARIAEQERSGQPVDQAWLDRVAPAGDAEGGSGSQQAELDRLMARLDSSISSFAETTRKAGGTTAAYGDSLQEHVGAMSGPAAGEGPTGEVLASLVGIARAMLERTREVEQEMKRSSHEADGLRESLERARRDAEIDHLTGLPNRRAFEAVLQREVREAQAEIDNLTVAICDIDRFKAVNDNHGHETGDRVIQAVAQVLARISHDRCHVARHGGEEFVLLFRGKSVAEASAILDEARASLASRHFVNRQTDQPIGQVTFSGGVTSVFAHADPREALRAADAALYRAKAEGRNRICPG